MSVKQQIVVSELQLILFETVFSLMERNENNKHIYDDLKRKINIMRKMANERQNGTLTHEKIDYYRKQFDTK